ncbi:hypothetical protein CH330_04895 [candidate division WOR-3 bacterium JGI_Cruoil_03_51_56]|uniref:Phosphoglucosamine mutase n=1 Tax=candidate division WOR-3 bacterium JGI_Cruoil_03_51_56 TaxID=1973747 RepID=A0A235BU03_UNCW3|nr:MAG: hypothetical protein CH330_04895 [candidate division WOR-3 bacterium JGI_Cruoil_03_51_56]
MQDCVFGISGLRGVVGNGFTAEVVTKVAAVFGNFIGPGIIAVGRDTRPSGVAFLSATAAGLMSAGCVVEDLGICPTPTVLHHVRLKGRDGAVVVTASHNPKAWNGMKFVGPDGLFLSPVEFERFRNSAERGKVSRADWRSIGELRRYQGAVDDHISAITENELFSDVRNRTSGIRVGVDAVNGAASEAAIGLIRKMGAEPVELNCRTDRALLLNGFPRATEPRACNLTDLSNLVRTEKLDFGVAFDPDGDRTSFVDETGEPLGEEKSICLACLYVLPRRKGSVVVNLSTTRAVEDICSRLSVKVERSAVGEASVVSRMKEIGAVLGGEGNGGVILPEVNFTRDGLVALGCVLGFLTSRNIGLSGLRKEIPEYRMVKSVLDLSRPEFDARRKRLLEEFSNARVDNQDGVKLEGVGYWVHVRPSNTEPVVRLIAETDGKIRAEDIVERAKGALKGM